MAESKPFGHNYSNFLATAPVQSKRGFGFGARGQWPFGANYVKRSAILVGATARYSINVISDFPGSLLLRVHSLLAFDCIYNRTAS